LKFFNQMKNNKV